MFDKAQKRKAGLFALPALLLAVSGLGLASQTGQAPASSQLPGKQLAVSGAHPSLQSASQSAANIDQGSIEKALVVSDVKHDVSPALSSLKDVPAAPRRNEAENETIKPLASRPQDALGVDTALQTVFGPLAMPTPILTFAGLGNYFGGAPPDTTGDVGPNHYVQFINDHYAVWNKSGNLVLAPLPGNALWSGFGGPCQSLNDGDPIVQYDQLADRWLLTQFALPSFPNGGTYQCFAISTTPDPTGTYYRYAFQTSSTLIEDYPHVSVWPDAYYMSTNEFASTGSFRGAGSFAFDRTAMLAGQPSRMVYFHTGSPYGGMQPTDLDGTRLPAAGAPNLFFEVDDDAFGPPFTVDTMSIFRFHVDWANPPASTFTALAALPVASYSSQICGDTQGACIPQPGTGRKLDGLADRIMYRVAYRNMGDHEAVVFNHTVNVGGHAGVRWYELRNISSTPSIYQQSTYSPDSVNRWMGSAAMDRFGNLAVGYSVSSASVSPGIRYAGRLSSDPLNQLAQGEATMLNGTGSQTGTYRWGDYSTLSVDPSDDCTFWYTQEYVPSTSVAGWGTRIGSFKFPGCGPLATPTPVPSPTPRCTGTRFSDVCPSDYFYTPVMYLSDRNIISGYSDNTFRPNNNVTRSQLSKIIVLAEGWALDTTGGPHFTDVPASNAFYSFVETAFNRGVISGYADGTFRPFVDVTRGQIAKIVVAAEGWALDTTGGPHFTDVPASNPFYPFIETAFNRGVISGYADNTFRWGNTATRGQVSKIVYIAVTQP